MPDNLVASQFYAGSPPELPRQAGFPGLYQAALPLAGATSRHARTIYTVCTSCASLRWAALDATSAYWAVNDPFNMQKFGYRTANGQVIEYSERFFGARAVFPSITRNFWQALRLRPKSDTEGNPTGPPTP